MTGYPQKQSWADRQEDPDPDWQPLLRRQDPGVPQTVVRAWIKA